MTKNLLLDLADAIATSLLKTDIAHPQVRETAFNLLQDLQRAVHRASTVASRDYAALLERTIERARISPLADIAAHLRAVSPSLPWGYHYQPRSNTEDLGERIGFAELIGPDGPLQAPRGRVGFTLMAEHTCYPMHAHPAIELYWVITGNARWQTPTSDRCVTPGEFVLHRSNEPHAMRTFDEPLLALWGWSGDTDSPAAYV